MKFDAVRFPHLAFSGGVKVGKGGETIPPHPTHPPLGGGGGGEVSGVASGVGNRWGKESINEGQTENVGPALAHMVTDANATLAGWLGRVSQ